MELTAVLCLSGRSIGEIKIMSHNWVHACCTEKCLSSDSAILANVVWDIFGMLSVTGETSEKYRRYIMFFWGFFMFRFRWRISASLKVIKITACTFQESFYSAELLRSLPLVIIISVYEVTLLLIYYYVTWSNYNSLSPWNTVLFIKFTTQWSNKAIHAWFLKCFSRSFSP